MTSHWLSSKRSDFDKQAKNTSGQAARLIRPLLITTLLLILTISSSTAADLIVFAIFPQEMTAGDTVEIPVYFINQSPQELDILVPRELRAQLNNDAKTPQPLTMVSSDQVDVSVTIPAHQFYQKTYQSSIPLSLQGRYSYILSGYPTTNGTVSISLPEMSTTPGIANAQGGKRKETYPTLENLELLYQTYATNLSLYRPIYFLVGTDPAKSKYQISLKYRLLNPNGTLTEKHPWLQGFHIGYTQTSFWDLVAYSQPFDDTSYKPELFFQSSNVTLRPNWMDALFLQAGFQHESNGQGDDTSRSTNYFYFEPSMVFYNPSNQLGMMLTPRVFYYYNNDDTTNRGFSKYRGNLELETKIGKANDLTLTTLLRFAEKGTSFQADLTYPIHRLLKNNLDLYLQIQYTNSLAESMLHYTERTEAVRIGIALVR